MTKKQKSLLFCFIIICFSVLFLINKNIKEFRYVIPYSLTFSEGESPKNYYKIGNDIVLKPGNYEIHYYGSNDGKQNGFRIQDPSGTILAQDVFSSGEFNEIVELRIVDNPVQVQFGVLYDGVSSLTTNKISVYCPDVLYRDSLITHAITSFLICLVFVLLALRFCFCDLWNRFVPGFLKGQNEKTFLLIAFLTAVSCFPFWISNSYILGDDLLFHLGRIEGMAESLKAGYFPARIHLFMLQNYGHGSGFFYPQIWLYIPTILRICGYSIITCYSLFITVCTFAALCSIYYCTVRISGNSWAGTAAVFLYAFASYRWIDVYYRAAIGEIQSFIFAPLVICAVYDILHDHTEKWPVLALGFFGLLGSHLISLGLVGLVFLVILICNFGKILRNKQIIPVVFKAGLLVVFAGAFFILPLIEQWNSTELVINRYLSAENNIDPHAPMSWVDMFSYFQTWIFYDNRKHPFPGLPLIAVIIFSLFKLKGKSRVIRYVRLLVVISGLTLWMATDLFPWRLFPWFLSRLQFSWRLLMIPTFLLPVCGGVIISDMVAKDKWKLLITALFCAELIFAIPFTVHTLKDRIRYYETFILENNRLGAGEYLPIGMAKADFREFVDKNRDTVHCTDEDVVIHEHNRQGLSFSFRFELPAVNRDAKFEIPLVFYKGYKGVFRDDSNDTKKLDVSYSDRGLTEVSGITSANGNIRIWYEKTTVQKIGEIISLCTVIAIFFGWGILRKKQRKY